MIDALPLLLGDDGYQISRSVRLRSSASAYFNRTPATQTNRKTWTWSGWTKVSQFGVASNPLFSAVVSGANVTEISFNASNQLDFFSQNTSGTVIGRKTSTAVYRDPSAWYHIVVAIDTSDATASNRIKIYVNGIQITSFAASTDFALNDNTGVNDTTVQRVGARASGTYFFDGYLTEVNFIDGQALTPSSFGETNTVTGVWQPKKYTGTYGTNGFYLNFSDNSAATAAAIGKDYSGNGNNWTPNNISVTAGVTYDSMLDVPTQWADGGNGRGNYATLNPVANPSTLLNANLTTNAGDKFSISTIGMTTGKWYCEVTVTTVGAESSVGISTQPYSGSTPYVGGTSTSWGYYSNNGNKYTNTSNAAYGATYTTGDVIGIAFDADNGTLEFFKNNTSQGTAYTGLTSGPYFFAVEGRTTTSANNCSINFGQRPFSYTPPSGFKALNTLNLPTPTILKGNQYFDATTYTGTSASNAVVNAGGFQPDLVWLKNRNYGTGTNHVLVDAVRGVSVGLASNLTNADFSTVGNFSSINSNGFTVTGTARDYNFLSDTFVGWQWKRGATQGFDIVTWTGTGAAQNISHNLGVAPAMIIWKYRSATSDWAVGHTRMNNGVNPWNYWAALNSTAAQAASAGPFNNTAPTSTQFTVGSFNANATNMVAYLFAEVAGFSKFGSYTGNGSADGPFVYCGFRPRYIMIKSSSVASTVWLINDTARKTFNADDTTLQAESSAAEGTSATILLDELSNGFKIRGVHASGHNNNNGATYIFMAFAENPFKNALAR